MDSSVIVHVQTITLRVHGLALKLARHAVGSDIEIDADGRSLTVDTATLGGNDNDTIAGAHTVKRTGGLSLQHVDALDVIGVQVNRTVGIIGTGNTLSCREVGV